MNTLNFTSTLTSNHTSKCTLKQLVLGTTAVLLLAACASSLTPPQGAAAARGKLLQLQTDTQLASRAPVEIREAELAVLAAENPESDQALGKHLVLLADQKVDIARYWAQSRLYEDEREALSQASEQARLDSRTLEADRARNESQRAQADAARARNDANVARVAANAARSDAADALSDANAARRDTADAIVDANIARNTATLARSDANAARQETEDLQQQIIELNARQTDRGLVVTLGDVLFETGQYTIQGGNYSNLDKLAVFLNRYADRTVTIEGHTDSVGEASFNQALSQNRANAVRDFLVSNGIASSRLTTLGQGEDAPIASNDSATGRQQNRRVEVIIANSLIASQ